MPLEQLKPLDKPRVIDLVAQAGVDTARWAFRKDGTRVEVPAANPAYCYDWCFENASVVVFSLWYDHMRIEASRVVQRINMRDLRRQIEKATHLDPGTKTANVNRAVDVDVAVQRAFKKKLPVRVIVCDGDRRDLDNIARTDPSKVQRRLLDRSPWHVTAYDYMGVTTGGDATIVRDEPLD